MDSPGPSRPSGSKPSGQGKCKNGRQLISTSSGSDEPSNEQMSKNGNSAKMPRGQQPTLEGLEEELSVLRCSDNIAVPPELVGILKEFTKSAIRTQPRDLLAWTKAYFSAKALGQTPPVKDRFEFPMAYSAIGLTIGILRVMQKQLKDERTVPKAELLETWLGLCLEESSLDDFIICGNLNPLDIDLRKLFALMCKTLSTSLRHAMDIICEMYTDEPDGRDALISFEIFWESYLAIAEFDDVEVDEELFLFLSENAVDGMVGPSLMQSENCPSLEPKLSMTSVSMVTSPPSAKVSGPFDVSGEEKTLPNSFSGHEEESLAGASNVDGKNGAPAQEKNL